MVAHGANGNTRQELMDALQLPMDDESTLLKFHDLIANLNDVRDVELHLANKLFIDNQFPLNRCFQKIITDTFQSEIQSMNFEDVAKSTEIINTWCQNKTKNTIKDIVKTDDLVGASLMMINAVYFKGAWNQKFTRHMDRKFHFSKTEFETIRMMCKIGYSTGWAIPDVASYTELLYGSADTGNGFTMYIILPEYGHTLDDVVARLTGFDFTSSESFYTHDYMCMPKFTINSDLDLIPPLQAMGIKDMFNMTSDFSNLSSANTYISKIIQKVFLNVDEEGSEAGAASGVVAVTLSLTDELVIDQPFLAAIVSKSSGIPLFVARVNDPRH